MSLKIVTVSLLVGLTVTSCYESQKQLEVSVLDLIVTPEEYQGKQIITEGFLNMDDKPRLFVSRDDAIYKIRTNSVMLSNSEFNGLRPCDQSYVQISGRFNQELTIESLQYIYTKDLGNQLLTPCWGKFEKKEVSLK